MDNPRSFALDINHEHRRLTTTFTDEVLPDDFAGQVAKCQKDGAGYDHLADLSNARFTLNAKEVHWLAGRLRHMAGPSEPGRLALLVTDDVSFGMARMLCALAYPEWTVEAFRNQADAMAWLGWGSASSASAVWRALARKRREGTAPGG